MAVTMKTKSQTAEGNVTFKSLRKMNGSLLPSMRTSVQNRRQIGPREIGVAKFLDNRHLPFLRNALQYVCPAEVLQASDIHEAKNQEE